MKQTKPQNIPLFGDAWMLLIALILLFLHGGSYFPRTILFINSVPNFIAWSRLHCEYTLDHGSAIIKPFGQNIDNAKDKKSLMGFLDFK